MPNLVMFAVVQDINFGEWERSRGEFLELDFEIAVCSQNAIPPQEAVEGWTRTHVEEECRFIRDLRNAILAEFRKDTGFMETLMAVRMPKDDNWIGYEEWLGMNSPR